MFAPGVCAEFRQKHHAMNYVPRGLAAALAGALLLACGACSQRWRFARADYPASGPQPSEASAGAAGGVAVPPGRPGVFAASSSRLADTSAVVPADGTVPSSAFPSAQCPVVDPLPPVLPQESCVAGTSFDESRAVPGFAARGRSMFRETWHNIRADHANYYSWATLRDLGFAVALAAPLANTSLDADFQDWYQRDVRSSGTDDFAAFWKTLGEGQIFIPAFAGLGLVGRFFEDRPLVGIAGEFGDRVTRGYLVGAPPMLFMQYLTGGSRPDEVSVGSQWKPFDDSNAVSGHAFMGAVPFITAAQMCDNGWAKSALYLCSTFTAWSRVNDHDHYLSQACLGWWMAYLACRNVEQTERADEWLTFTPMITPEVAGVGMVVRR